MQKLFLGCQGRVFRKRVAIYYHSHTHTHTQMQAWWRGMMVRKCLGPFAKKKKGKAKGKGKGKKGKKKKQ